MSNPKEIENQKEIENLETLIKRHENVKGKLEIELKELETIKKELEVNCKINLILTWSSTCVITNSKGAGTFAITSTKLYVPVVTLSIQENAKLLQQIKSCFKRKINWNKYLSKTESHATKKPYLDKLIDPNFE